MDVIKVFIEPREDGGIRVRSDDLPGLILSGKNRIAVLKDIEPAAKVLREHRSNFEPFRIDAIFVGTQSTNT